MWEFLTASGNIPFSVALLFVFALAMLEGVGMLIGAGLSGFIDHLLPSVDMDVDVPNVEAPGVVSQILGWFYVGKVPFLIVLIALLTSFGIIGLIMQSVVQTLSGYLLPALLAAPLALAGALPVSRGFTALIARIMPRDETEAVSADSFVGRVAIITTGNARHGSAAQARLNDQYGQTHYVMVEPEAAEAVLPSGSEVLLIKKNGTRFLAIANPKPVLVD
ncbi:MAG TPA: YqiJ family protein [Gammaproteobacteria bacterium]